MILVVGLGNPGTRYQSTRHNVGFMVVERLVARCQGGPWQERFRGRLAALALEGERALALEPQTFMNDSGSSVQPCAAFYKVEPESIVVVHDELDLPLAEVRLKRGGGDAGHNGLKSITRELGTSEYVRVRLGIGRPDPEFAGDVADYVLQGFPLADRAGVEDMLDRAVEAITLFASRGLSLAMNVVNQRKKLSTEP